MALSQKRNTSESARNSDCEDNQMGPSVLPRHHLTHIVVAPGILVQMNVNGSIARSNGEG